ncbi:protein kinase domain-containing protein, partial [Bacillus sp. GMs2/2]|uniref:protein kinase domain-containing protein n=1 Tax=Bacillus sp. GMs2/2 TaxID=3418494 RepID=UPI003CF4055E
FIDGYVYTEREVFEILYEILESVSVFHSEGIIHRDLRIPNILMKENQISIIDFGLAKWKGEDDERATTYEGEQALMREVHFRSDFYALGHFSLFLLYAGYESNEKQEKPWYEELTLEHYNREILMRMLQIKTPYYENVQDLKQDVASALERMETPCFKSF